MQIGTKIFIPFQEKVENMLLKPFKDEKEVVAVILRVRALTSSYWNRKVSGIGTMHIGGK